MKSSGYLYDLSTLRDIGFSLWDPIGLAHVRDQYPDEYDSYLMQAAGHAIRGQSPADVSEYLLSCCHEMGGEANELAAHAAAQAIVRAVSHAKTGAS